MPNSIIKKILARRGIRTEAEVSDFFNPGWEKFFHDPYKLQDMERAVERLKVAVRRKQKVAVVGDYDGDGIPGAAIVFMTLRKMGAREPLVSVAKAHQVEESFVRSLAARRYKALVTVDFGTSSFRAAQLARSLGIDMIVLDHHVIQHRRPSVYAYINPRQNKNTYPWPHLSGAGLALKLAAALSPEVFLRSKKYFTALAAIAAVHDQMPLEDENRMLVRKGLQYLATLRGSDLNMAMRFLKTKDSLKGAGRDTAFRLLEHLFNIFESQESCDLLVRTGHSRRFVRTLTDASVRFHRNLNEGVSRIKRHPHFYKKNLLFEVFEDLPYVTAGPVASRVFHWFGVTTFVLRKGEGKFARGSGRSGRAVDLMDLLSHTEDMLSGYGGRPQQVGFTIKNSNIDEFRRRIARYLKKNLPGGRLPRERMRIDATVTVSELTPALYRELERMAPFGNANPVPLLAVRGVKLYSGGDDALMKDRSGLIPAALNERYGQADLKGRWTAVGTLAMAGDVLYFRVRELRADGRS